MNPHPLPRWWSGSKVLALVSALAYAVGTNFTSLYAAELPPPGTFLVSGKLRQANALAQGDHDFRFQIFNAETGGQIPAGAKTVTLTQPVVAGSWQTVIDVRKFGAEVGILDNTVHSGTQPITPSQSYVGILDNTVRPPQGWASILDDTVRPPMASRSILDNTVHTATALNWRAAQGTWLQISVRRTGGGEFVPLSPRQRLTAVPGAVVAQTANHALVAGTVSEGGVDARALAPGAITAEKISVGAINGAALANLAVTSSKIAPLTVVRSLNGLQDDVRLAAGTGVSLSAVGGTITINSTSAGGGTPLPNGNFIGANNDNQFGGSASFGVIGGGQSSKISDENAYSTLGGGQLNRIYERSSWSFLGGGYNHQVGPDAAYASLGGGYSHILTNANSATIAGGSQNVAGGDYATVGGGSSNFAGPAGTVAGGGGNRAEGSGATVGGGFGNLARSAQAIVGGGNANSVETSPYGTVAGGFVNRLTNSIGGSIGGGEQNGISNARGSVVGGGLDNMAGTPYSSIIGGEGNRTEGLGGYVTVLGGSHNLASATHSLAAGYRAHAVHNGSFVWNAWQGDVFSSKRDGEFAVHAPGGVRLQTDGGGLFVDGQRVGGGGGGGLLDGSIATATLANAAVTLPKLAISGTPGEGKLLSYSDGTLNWASAPAGNTGVTGGWALGGNAGTDPAVNFLGTTDDRPLVIRVENEPALRMEWATNLLSVVQGLDSGTVALNVTLGRGFIRPGVVGAIVGGIRHRSNADTLGPNAVYGNDSIALGGASNVAGKPDADLLFSNGGAFVGGGHVNAAYGQNSVVVGGNANAASGFLSSVVGGRGNEAHGSGDFVGGGLYNAAHGGDSPRFLAGYSAIAGGRQNLITNAGSAFIGGGRSNRIGELADSAVIGGGLQNEATGSGSMIVGGISNLAAGIRSFAAGTEARANHTGSFVWNDGSAGGFGSSRDNEFAVHAAGGARFDTGGAGVRADKLSITGNGTIEAITGGNQTQPQLRLEQTVPGEYVRVFLRNPGSIFGLSVGGPNGWLSFSVPGQSPANTVDTGADRFIITPNGEVGVGSDRPFAQFHVRGRGGFDLPQIRATQQNPQDFARLRLETGQQAWDIAAGPDGTLRFFRGGADRMVLGAAGLTVNGRAVAYADQLGQGGGQPVNGGVVTATVTQGTAVTAIAQDPQAGVGLEAQARVGVRAISTVPQGTAVQAIQTSSAGYAGDFAGKVKVSSTLEANGGIKVGGRIQAAGFGDNTPTAAFRLVPEQLALFSPANPGGITSTLAILDHPHLNGNPNALLLLTPVNADAFKLYQRSADVLRGDFLRYFPDTPDSPVALRGRWTIDITRTPPPFGQPQTGALAVFNALVVTP